MRFFAWFVFFILSYAAVAQVPDAPRRALPPADSVARPLAPTLTLAQALQTALKNSLDIQISRTNADVQAVYDAPGFAGALPTVGVVASNNVVVNNTQQDFNTGMSVTRTGARATQYNVGLAGSYTLYNGGRVVATRKRLGELAQIGQLQLNSTVQNVLADVSLKYYAVVQQQRYIRTLEASVEVSKQKLRLIRARQSVGLANNADLFQAQLDLNAQLETRQQQALAAQQATADLLRALTLDLDTRVAVEDTIPVNRDLHWLDIEAALTKNPDLLAAERQVRVNELLERAARAALYPSLALNSGTNFARNQNAVGTTLFNQSYGPYAGLSLGVPIYSGGVSKRLVTVARLNTRTAELQRTALAQTYRLNARKAWEAYQQTLALVNTAADSYDTAKKLLHLVQLRLDAGLSLGVPLYSGGVNKRLVTIARLNTRTAELQRTALEQTYRLNARKAWEAYQQTLALVNTAADSYDTAKKLLHLVQLRLDAGLSTLVDVKLAQQSFEDAGYRLTNYRYSAKSAEITLQQLAALLTP